MNGLQEDDLSGHLSAVIAGERFEFGKNWSHFLAVLDGERIVKAEQSLRMMLDVKDFSGKGFLDVGSGSGLFFPRPSDSESGARAA